MFGFFKKKVPIEDTEPFKMGQRAANSYAEDLDTFMVARFEPVYQNLMGVLDDRLESVYDDPNGPPILLAKVEYKAFLDNVQEMRPRMEGEINAAMSEWLSVASEMGMREDFDRLATARLNSFYERLTINGFQALMDKTDKLGPADIKWRTENPELATRFPEPE